MNDIEKADQIVGLTMDNHHDWCGPWLGRWKPHIRRGAYAAWFAKRSPDTWPTCAESLESQAERIVRIHAEESKPRQPDDGLPPGPWVITHNPSGTFISEDHGNFKLLPLGLTNDSEGVLCEYLARCGSPAVRRLLAAFDVTEERTSAKSVALCHGHAKAVHAEMVPEAWADIQGVVCWLTPRSKP